MALAAPSLFYRFSTLPSPPLCFSLRKFFYSTSVFPHSSFPLHSQFLLLSRSSRPYSTSSFALNTHEIEHEGSVFPIISDSEDAEKLREEEDEILTEQPQATEPVNVLLPRFPTPKLTIKEKKELASYAHSLGKKLKSQQVGKSGVIPPVAAAMLEALEANELLKLKVHGSCPGELSDVVKQLENATGSTAVSQIGRTVILYRPSLAKMKKKDSDQSRKQQQTIPVKSATALKASTKKQVTRTFKLTPTMEF